MPYTAENQRIVNVITPGLGKDGTSWTTTEIDTVVAGLGKAHYVTIYVMFGQIWSVPPTQLEVQEGDVSGTHAAIAGLDFTGGFPATDDDNTIWAFRIPMEGRKRYLDLKAVAGNAASVTFACAWAVLEWFDKAPQTAAHMGLSGRKLPT